MDFDAVNPDDYDGLYIPGGRGAEYIRLEPRVLEIVKKFFQDKKPIAMLCHGPQVMATAGVLRGVTCTAYKAIKPEMEMAGAIFQEVPNTQSVVDPQHRIVSGRDWITQPYVVRDFLKLLGVTSFSS